MEELNNFITTYENWIVSLAGIGTFISSLIAIYTLREVKKQRLSQYQPDVRIKSFNVSTNKSPLKIKQGELLRYRVCDFNDKSINFDKIKFEVNPNYKVENLGFGVARNVKCSWNFNHKKAKKIIDKIISQEYEITDYKELDYYFLNLRFDDEFQYSAITNIEAHHIDYIAPINIQEHNHYHSIPDIILFSHILFLIFQLNLTGDIGKNFHIFEFKDYDFPIPTLKIEYVDLNNKKYVVRFDFDIAAVVTQIGDNIDFNKEFMYLNFDIKH